MTAVAATENTGTVIAAVRRAATETGADFDYLLRTASRESSLKSDAKAPTSSAAGLFQFIEQTWFDVVKKNGAAFGLGREAEAIEARSDGRYDVADRATREAILALRHDPEVSSLMAGAHVNETAEVLEGGIGRTPTEGELYMAHFLGTAGATKLINALKSDPDVRAAHLFPAAAKANRSIFYRADGSAKTVAEVYERLDRQPELPAAAVAALEGIPMPNVRPTFDRPANHAGAVASYRSAPQSGAGPLSFALAQAGQSGPGPLTFALNRPTVPGAGPSLVLTPQVIEVLTSLDGPSMDGTDESTEAREKRADRSYDLPPENFAWLRGGSGLRGTLA